MPSKYFHHNLICNKNNIRIVTEFQEDATYRYLRNFNFRILTVMFSAVQNFSYMGFRIEILVCILYFCMYLATDFIHVYYLGRCNENTGDYVSIMTSIDLLKSYMKEAKYA